MIYEKSKALDLSRLLKEFTKFPLKKKHYFRQTSWWQSATEAGTARDGVRWLTVVNRIKRKTMKLGGSTESQDFFS